MPKLPDLVARIRLDTSQLDRATGQVNASTTSMASGFGRIGTAAKLGLVAAGVALAKFGKDSISAASESRKVTAQTRAVVRSTGGAAKVSVKQIGALAAKLQKLSGVSDESIQTGQNLLLTFTGIRNEAGKGNDIFDQATRTMLDMSVALGTDAKSSAIQLGKALNDPIKGISALSRVGVSFTDEQKGQIRTAVEAGDVLGAQKIILAELKTEFGGSAKAAGEARTPMEKLKLVFEDIQEAIGEKVLVALDGLSAWVEEHGPFVRDWFSLMGERVRFLADWFDLMGEKVAGWGQAFRDVADTLVGVQDSIGGFFVDLWNWAKDAADAVGDLLDKLNNIPGMGLLKKIGKTFLSGKIPGFAKGGVVPGPVGAPQLAVVHGGERVIPNGGGGSSMTVNQNIYGGQSPDDIARAIAWHSR